MLTRLFVTNYRCLVNFTFHPGRTGLLVGDNGVGKTSIFDVLGAIQDLVCWHQSAEEAFPPNTLTTFGDSSEQRFELDVRSEWGSMRYTLLLVHDVATATCKIKHEEVTLDSKPLYRFVDAEVQLYQDDHSPARDTFSFTPKRSFLASLEPKPFNQRVTWLKEFITRIWVLKLDPRAARASSRVDRPFLDRDGANFASWCRHLLTDAPDRIEAATTVLRGVVPAFERLRMQAAGRAKILVATFSFPGARSYDLDFDVLSDGQKALIILYLVLFAIADESALLCFDEPDNFVSLREIQPFLIELMKTADDHDRQWLLISHSPEVIDVVGLAEATLLERPEGGVTRVGDLVKGSPLKLSELLARGWHAQE